MYFYSSEKGPRYGTEHTTLYLPRGNIFRGTGEMREGGRRLFETAFLRLQQDLGRG